MDSSTMAASSGRLYAPGAASTTASFNFKEEKKRLKRIVSKATNMMVEVSDTAQLNVLDAPDEDQRKSEIMEALREIVAQQKSAAEAFKKEFGGADAADAGADAGEQKRPDGFTEEQKAGLHELAVDVTVGFE